MKISEKSKKEYLGIILNELMKRYKMSYNDAKEAVDSSLAKQLLYENDGELADVQMHDSLDYTVEYTYCAYKGMPIEYLQTL